MSNPQQFPVLQSTPLNRQHRRRQSASNQPMKPKPRNPNPASRCSTPQNHQRIAPGGESVMPHGTAPTWIELLGER